MTARQNSTWEGALAALAGPAPGSILNLTPAPPGWTVTITNNDGTPDETSPVIGWAVVTYHLDADNRTFTQIEPAFLYHGRIRYENELHDLGADIYEIHAPATTLIPAPRRSPR